MDKSLLIFIAVVVLFAYRGYRNGLLKSVGRILGIAAGYLCAIVYTGAFSGIVTEVSGLQGVAAFIAASLILFVGASIAVTFLFWIISRFILHQHEVTAVSSLGGAAVGTLTGVLVAVIIVWAFAFVRDVMPGSESFASVDPQPAGGIEKLANQVASSAVKTALEMGSVEPEVQSIGSALFKAPGEVVQRAQVLSQSPELQQLLNDPRNRLVLNTGDPDAVRKLPDFQRLARNPDMLAFMKSAGMLEHAAENNQDIEQALAGQLTNVWVRARQARHDPRLQEILRDPEFQRQVQSGNPLDLLTNDKLLELANIIFSDGSEGDGGLPQTPSPSSTELSAGDNQPIQPVKKKKKKIYTWTDENGKLHISDVKPDP